METNLETEREEIRWVRNAIEKGYNWDGMEELLRKSEVSNSKIKELSKIYNEETEAREKMDLTWRERRGMRKLIKKSKVKLSETLKVVNELNSLGRKKTKEEEKVLSALRDEMELAILDRDWETH